MNVREAVHRFSELKSKCESLTKENETLRSQVADMRKQLQETEEKLKLVELTSTIIDKEDKTELKDRSTNGCGR